MLFHLILTLSHQGFCELFHRIAVSKLHLKLAQYKDIGVLLLQFYEVAHRNHKHKHQAQKTKLGSN